MHCIRLLHSVVRLLAAAGGWTRLLLACSYNNNNSNRVTVSDWVSGQPLVQSRLTFWHFMT
jgi:hypothetical protein